ncbi:MAG: hypothetical protein MZV65_15925 [Chromatiales bacterium]|nr:hypothetical protein [Chromatiales bacterium]
MMKSTRHAEVLLEGLDQVEDLGLDGHVQGRGGLVADEDLAAGRPRPTAITARCRMPPENSWGYWPYRGSGSAMPTRSRISTTAGRRGLPDQAPVQRGGLPDLLADGLAGG